MQRINAEPRFTDLTVADLGGPTAAAFFGRCERAIPFTDLAASVADIFDDADPSPGGRPHWPVETIVRILFLQRRRSLLQKCFGLSDPMAEEMLKDRISFRRFVGLGFDDGTPDHGTPSVFRKRLLERGHGVTLLDKTVAALDQKGLLLKTGTLIDATIIEARSAGSGTTAPRPPTPAPARPSRADAPTSATAPTSPPTGAASSLTSCSTPPPRANTRTSTNSRRRRPRRCSPTAGAGARTA